MAETVIASCECASAYQDKKYGPGKRVHNVKKNGARCTVCDKERS